MYAVLQDMYVYVSESDDFEDFKNKEALFWVQKGLTYGDWESGPNGDGSYEISGQVQASEVRVFCHFVSFRLLRIVLALMYKIHFSKS
jgi:hypothetical protein